VAFVQAGDLEDSGAVHDATLIDATLPLVPGLVDRLRQGIDVADVGCGSGHAVNLMAEAFPRSGRSCTPCRACTA
jgi:SAM-dependent methyltransferase